jgi:surfactin family lipopeptide synthetase C
MTTAQIPAPIEDIYELSPLQQGMLFHTLHAPKSALYFEQEVFSVEGGLHMAAFAECWQHVMRRHPVLRTSFHWSGLEKPLQVVHREATVPIQWTNLRHLSTETQDRTLETYLAADRQRALNLEVAPVMRLQVFDVAADVSKFVWSFHHMLLDGWSGQIVLREVAAIYEAIRQRRAWHLPPVRPYRDYIVWLQRLDSDKPAVFWQRILQPAPVLPTPLGIPTVRPREKRIDRYGEHEVSVPADVTSAVEAFARRHRLTLNTIVQGAWAVLLSRYGGESDVVFGAVVSGRPASMAEVENMVGLFINTIPVRVRVAPDTPVAQWLGALQAEQSEAREFQYNSLVDIRRWSGLPANVGLLESVLVCENFPVTRTGRDLGQPASQSRYLGRTNYPVTVLVMPAAEMRVKFEFDATRYDAATMARMAGHYRVLLEGIVAGDGRQAVGRLPLLSEVERRQVVEEWNATAVAHEGGCLHQWFEAQVMRTPQALACIDGAEQLTYAQLNARANQLARHLRGLGVGAEVLVGIALERSAALLVALLGVLKAGGAYVPLDPAYPGERLGYMLADAQARVLLTQASLVERVPVGSAQLLCVDTQWGDIEQHEAGNLDVPVRDDQLAYVIYTSGSTGVPKGVMIEQGGLANYLAWSTREYAMPGGRGAPVHSPISFDLTVTSLFCPLLAGQTVVLLPEGATVDALAACLREHADFSLVKITPAHVEALSHLLRIDEVGGKVRTLVIGGEPLSWHHVEFWRAHAPRTRLINEYGPTEAVVGCCIYELGSGDVPADRVPIGQPIANMRCYVLDAYQNPVPVGVIGELHIGGRGVARGYLNLPELTEQKFIPDPFAANPRARLYKSGDLARYLPDGNLEFLGRRDQQVKLRGFRIELGEIEAVLRLDPCVRDAAVQLGQGPKEDRRLVAYVVPRDAEAARPGIEEALRRMLHAKLPEYMMPTQFVLLHDLPLTPRGKLDHAALPAPDATCPVSCKYTAPRTPVERIVARMFEDVLGVTRAGVQSDFFAHLGGHSLLATALVSRIREVFKLQLPLQRIFESPTVAALADALLEDEQTRHVITTTAEVWLETIEADDREDVNGNSADRQTSLSAGRTT